MSAFNKLTRRSFLALTAALPRAAWGAVGEPEPRYFQYDHVVGTSLDLIVWASDAVAAGRANVAVLEEIRRLTSILSTRDPESEISRFETSPGATPSRELADVLDAYSCWTDRTRGVLSIRPAGPGAPRNVDALGKAYIIDRAARAASAVSGVSGLLLNIGGDIVSAGRPCEIAVANPSTPQDNAPPLTWIRLHNAAVATSGEYARGGHLMDTRTGRPALRPASGTVIAPDAVTANALATSVCLMSAHEGMELVERVHGAEALRVANDGGIVRTSGFARLEIARPIPAAVRADWPSGNELSITLTLTNGASSRGGGGPAGRGKGSSKRQYVAIWIENTSGKLIRVLAFWADSEKYFAELSSFFTIAGGSRRVARGRGQSPLAVFARATRSAGRYLLVWDGLDQESKPVPLGTYRVVVETSQEHGQYAKQVGLIDCADKPAQITLSATSNFEPVLIQYGPRPRQA